MEYKHFLDTDETVDLTDVYVLVKKAGWLLAKRVLASNIIDKSLQEISITNFTLEISKLNSPVDLSILLQNLDLTENILSVENGNSVRLSKFFNDYYCSELSGQIISNTEINFDAFACIDDENKEKIKFKDVEDFASQILSSGWHYIFATNSGIIISKQIDGTGISGAKRRIGSMEITGNSITGYTILPGSLMMTPSKYFKGASLKIRKVLPQGTHGGDAVSGWNVWEFTRIDFNNIPESKADDTNNEITLPTGKYSAYIQTSIYQIRARAVLIDNHNNEYIATNWSNYSGSKDAMLNTQGTFTLNEETILQFKIDSSTNNTTDGLGRAANRTGKEEFYGVVIIEKLK